MSKYWVFILLGVVGSACKSYNYHVFSNQVIDEYNLDKATIQELQFYTSGEITLFSKKAYGSKGLENGKLRKDSKRELDEFVIPKHTPGIVRKITEKGQLAVNFDAQNPECVLMFGVHPSRNNQYVLLAETWEQGVGTIPFCGTKYQINPESRNVYLLVDEKATRKTQRKTKVARGATIR